jgi:hypothetical protein
MFHDHGRIEGFGGGVNRVQMTSTIPRTPIHTHYLFTINDVTLDTAKNKAAFVGLEYTSMVKGHEHVSSKT